MNAWLGGTGERIDFVLYVHREIAFHVVAIQPGALSKRVAVRELDVALLLFGTVRKVVSHLSATAHHLDLRSSWPTDSLVAA